MSSRSPKILIVEDNPDDVLFLREAMREVEFEADLEVVSDGELGLRFLRQEGEFIQSERPDLILLDLNLPRLGGHETLAAIKGDPRYRSIPVIVMSSSTLEQDVDRAYQLHANAYLEKRHDCAALARSLALFWFNVVTLASDLPTRHGRQERHGAGSG